MFKSLISASLLVAIVGCSTASITAPSTTAPSTTTSSTTEAATTSPNTTAAVASARYVDEVFTQVAATTDVVYATAPALVSGEPTELHLNWYAPAGDTETARPAIVWIHGGGFKGGSRETTADVAEAYARRGYVTASIDYRLDPGNDCNSGQSKEVTDVNHRAAGSSRCVDAILAAQHDAQAAIRWLRANATDLGVDPNRIAVAGFSAGAITAINVAQRSDDPGDIGDDDTQSSKVSAAFAASGCNFDPSSIDADDAPIFLLASDNDPVVSFLCVATTERATIAAGGEVETLYFTGSNLHALKLYDAHRSQVDDEWTAFLAQQLNLA